MLFSDVLHNSSAPVKNASAYRTKFEATLPDIMESFNDLYCSVTGRMTAEALKERVLKVLQVWSDWFLFSDTYVNGLRATFLRSSNAGVVSFHSIHGDASETENRTNSEGAVDMVEMNRGASTKELMDLPLAELERRCRHNGLSLAGGREMMAARLLSLEEAERQSGYGLDHESKFAPPNSSSGRVSSGRRETNIEAEPVDGEMSSLNKAATLLSASRWARDDDYGSDDEQKRSSRGLGLSYSSSGSETEFTTDASIPAVQADIARKRHRSLTRSESPSHRSSTKDGDRERHRDRGSERRDGGRDRDRGGNSGWRDRNDHDRDGSRDRRRRMK